MSSKCNKISGNKFVESREYESAWKEFRNRSNEYREIENHLVSRLDKLYRSTDAWPVSFLDVGTGNGMLASRVLRGARALATTLKRIDVVEPLDYVHEAVERIQSEVQIPNGDGFRAWQNTFANWFEARSNRSGTQPEYDLILASHVVYYLEDGDLDRLITCLSDSGRLLVVTDPLDSLFSACWRRAAPDAYRTLQLYYEWCEHQTISYKERIPIDIRCEEIDSCVEALLPILTLRPNSGIDQNTREEVRSEIISRRDGEHISTPVEIIEFTGE